MEKTEKKVQLKAAVPAQRTVPSAFRTIAADSRVGPKQYVKNFVAPGGGE